MRRILLVFTLLLSALLTACTSPSHPQNSASIPNPIHETDEAGIVAATGISLPAPSAAEDVSWSYIERGDAAPLAQMQFTLDGKKAFLRAQTTGKTNLDDLEDISGLYYDWTAETEEQVAYCKAKVCTNGEVGYVAWLDVVPGVQYCLGMTEGAGTQELVKLANQVFVPLQGDS